MLKMCFLKTIKIAMQLFLLVSVFIFSINLNAAEKIVDQRLEVGPVWNAITGDRKLFIARIDTVKKILSIEKYESNTSGKLIKLEWRRSFPLDTSEQAQLAKKELEKYELRWGVDEYMRLHARDCTALFVDIPIGTIETLSSQIFSIVDKLEAQSEDISMTNLIEISATCGLPKFKLTMVVSLDGKIKRFAVVSNNGEKLALHIKQQQGQLLIKHNDLTMVRIAPVQPFDPAEGGSFVLSSINDCQKMTFSDFEFELRSRYRNGKRQWQLQSFRELDGRISLAHDRDPEIDVGMVIINAPVDLVEGVLDGIFGTLIWNIFISSDGKKEMIAKSIFEEAKKNETLKEVFSEKELKKMSEDIASNSRLPWFAPFSGTDAIKKRASMVFAFELVRKSVMDKLPEGSLPDMAYGVALRVTRDLDQCLNGASSGKDIDVCVGKFARSAPYRVGRELLSLHLKSGLKGQDLTEQENTHILNIAKDRYDQCSQQNYFGPYDEHIKKIAKIRRKDKEKKKKYGKNKGLLDDELPFDSDKVVMSCLFESVLESSLTVTETSIDKLLVDIDGAETQKSALKSEVLNTLRQCYAQQGFVNNAEQFRQYNHLSMRQLSVEIFTPKFQQCIGQAKTNAGAHFLAHQILNNPALVAATQGKLHLRQEVLERALTRAYRPCLEKQGENPDATRCQTMLENVATEESFVLILEHQLSQSFEGNQAGLNFALREVGLGTLETKPYNYNLRQCFRTRLDALFKLLSDGDVLPTDEFSNANCITRAILELAPYLVRQKYLQTINSKPDLKTVPGLKDEEFIRKMGAQMRQCLLLELRGLNTVEAVSSMMESAQSRCTVALYKTIMPEVIEKVLTAKLLKIVSDPERRQRLIERLKNLFAQKISFLDNEEKILQELDIFAEDAAMAIVRQSLEWSVEDNILERPALQQELTQQLLETIITPTWEQEFRTAIRNNDNVKQQRMQAQLKKDAGPKILQKALPLRLENYVTNTSTRNIIVKGVVQEYQKCLEKIKIDHVDFDKKFDQCVTKAANHATHAVFDASLSLALNQYFPIEGSAANKAGNKAAQQKIKTRLLGAAFWREVASANAKGGKAVERLGDKIKVRAAREVADVLIERELFIALGSESRNVTREVQAISHQCFNPLEKMIEKNQQIKLDHEIDLCSRKIKREAPWYAMESIFKQKMGLLSSDQNKVDDVMNKTKEFYNTCTSPISSMKSEQITSLINDCTSKTIVDFAKNLGRETIDFLAPIRSGNESILTSFQRCLQTAESQRERGMDFLKIEVDKCVSTQLKPRLIREIHHYFNSKITMKVSGGERAVIEDTFTILAPFFDDQIITTGSGIDPITVLDQTFNQLIKFIAPAAQFDQVTTQRRITEFKRAMRVKVATGKITQAEFTEELVRSSLMDTIIEAQIATTIGAAADEAWIGGTIRTHVTSPENMREFFEVNPKGRAIMQAIKREVVRPMLAGVPMSTIMTNVSTQIRIEVNKQIDTIKRELRALF